MGGFEGGDESGYWEEDVCPGNIEIGIKIEDLPEGYKLEADFSTISRLIEKGKQLESINIPLIEQSDPFNWYYLILPVLLICLMILIWYLINFKSLSSFGNFPTLCFWFKPCWTIENVTIYNFPAIMLRTKLP